MLTRLLLAFALFAELVVLGTLVGIVALGKLPSSPAALVYAAGVLVALSAAIVFALPSAWAKKASLHGALLAGAALFALPFVWLVGTSFKYPEETFVRPPQWVPDVARPRATSPYLTSNHPLRADATFDAWSQIEPFVPTEQAQRFNADDVRAAMVGELTRGAGGSVTVTQDGVREAWDRVYRAFVLGTLSVRAEGDRIYAVPPDALTLTEVGPSYLFPNASGQLVEYAFNSEDSFYVEMRIDPAWLAHTLDGRKLVGFALPMRQDRTWHKLDFALAHGGQRYVTRDALHLGDDGWREVGGTTERSDEGQDPRALGVFPLYADGSAANGDTTLTLNVRQNSQLRATFAKYAAAYRDAWYADRNWGRYVVNSLLLAALNVAGQLLACSMAAYGFARLRWPGRDLAFGLVLATMMLPAFVTMVPTFLIFRWLGWYDTLYPLWVPALAGTPFYIFLLRQFMLGVPRELEEAARVDGCGWVGIYWRVVLPLVRPALATVAVFTFMATWNEFMGPLIYLADERRFPLALGLMKFRTLHGGDYGMLMAASTLMTLPVVGLFFACQRYFIQGAALTGIKG